WPSLNTVTPNAQATPVENMIRQGIIDLPLFTVNLDKGDNNGFYTFGVIDAAKAGVKETDIKYTPVDKSQGFWMFSATKAIVNGETIELSSNTAIADIGITLAVISYSVVSAIWATIPGSKLDQNQGGYGYPAGATVPDVEFAIGNLTFKVNTVDFSLGAASDGFLFGGIQSRGSNPFDILGDVFLKSVYAVFDQGNTCIGMAQRS
ncbi:acid protease, partial [Athelia psychrophila]